MANGKAEEEYNFVYILPQEAGKPIVLVVPTLLQMGWVEYPETARDIALDYSDTPVGSLPPHKCVTHVTVDKDVDVLPATSDDHNRC